MIVIFQRAASWERSQSALCTCPRGTKIVLNWLRAAASTLMSNPPTDSIRPSGMIVPVIATSDLTTSPLQAATRPTATALLALIPSVNALYDRFDRDHPCATLFPHDFCGGCDGMFDP